VVDDDIGARPGGGRAGQMCEDLGQLTEPQLGGSTTPACVLGEADRSASFWRHPSI
jgi:hypothetical protein